MASRFVQLTDPKQVMSYLEADMLYYLLDVTDNMRYCIYGILVEEDEGDE